MSYYSDDDDMQTWLSLALLTPAQTEEFFFWLDVYRLLHYGFEVLARGEEP